MASAPAGFKPDNIALPKTFVTGLFFSMSCRTESMAVQARFLPPGRGHAVVYYNPRAKNAAAKYSGR